MALATTSNHGWLSKCGIKLTTNTQDTNSGQARSATSNDRNFSRCHGGPVHQATLEDIQDLDAAIMRMLERLQSHHVSGSMVELWDLVRRRRRLSARLIWLRRILIYLPTSFESSRVFNDRKEAREGSTRLSTVYKFLRGYPLIRRETENALLGLNKNSHGVKILQLEDNSKRPTSKTKGVGLSTARESHYEYTATSGLGINRLDTDGEESDEEIWWSHPQQISWKLRAGKNKSWRRLSPQQWAKQQENLKSPKPSHRFVPAAMLKQKKPEIPRSSQSDQPRYRPRQKQGKERLKYAWGVMEPRCHRRSAIDTFEEWNLTYAELAQGSNSSIQAYVNPQAHDKPLLTVRSVLLSYAEFEQNRSGSSSIDGPDEDLYATCWSNGSDDARHFKSSAYRKLDGIDQYLKAATTFERRMNKKSVPGENKAKTRHAKKQALAPAAEEIRILPPYYASLSVSGKRRARTKALKTESSPMGLEPKGVPLRKQTASKEIKQWRKNKVKRGTDPFSQCHSCWQSYMCGHVFRTLCPDCDSSWDKRTPILCPLYTQLGHGCWKPEDFAYFWDEPCGICPGSSMINQADAGTIQYRIRKVSKHIWTYLWHSRRDTQELPVRISKMHLKENVMRLKSITFLWSIILGYRKRSMRKRDLLKWQWLTGESDAPRPHESRERYQRPLFGLDQILFREICRSTMQASGVHRPGAIHVIVRCLWFEKAFHRLEQNTELYRARLWTDLATWHWEEQYYARLASVQMIEYETNNCYSEERLEEWEELVCNYKDFRRFPS